MRIFVEVVRLCTGTSILLQRMHSSELFSSSIVYICRLKERRIINSYLKLEVQGHSDTLQTEHQSSCTVTNVIAFSIKLSSLLPRDESQRISIFATENSSIFRLNNGLSLEFSFQKMSLSLLCVHIQSCKYNS